MAQTTSATMFVLAVYAMFVVEKSKIKKMMNQPLLDQSGSPEVKISNER